MSGNFKMRTGVVHPLRTVLLASTALCGASALPAVAQDATWRSTPGTGDFNTAANASLARDSALVTASAETKWLNGISVAATFEGEFSRLTESYAGKGVVRYQW